MPSRSFIGASGERWIHEAWLHSSAIWRVSSTVAANRLCWPRMGDVMRPTTLQDNKTWSQNLYLPLHTLSPFLIRSKIPHLSVITQSLTVAPQSSDTNVVSPPGDIPERALKVFWCLQWEKVIAWLCNDSGHWMNNFVQSMMTLVLGYLWNCSGVLAMIMSLLGQANTSFSS